MTNYNNNSFSIAWKIGPDGQWKTYYRKFHLQLCKYKILRGQYISNLYFDEDLDLDNQDIYFMIYAMAQSTPYSTIKDSLNKNSFEKMNFYNIFILKKQEWAKYRVDLKFSKKCNLHLINEENNLLEIQAYKGASTHMRNENVYGITLPSFRIKLNSIKHFN
jgi:hypothetical protein